MDDTTYTVGALAKASGLTVRTLHHWDAMSAELQQYVGRATAARGS